MAKNDVINKQIKKIEKKKMKLKKKMKMAKKLIMAKK